MTTETATATAPITFYGASDDLLEVEGAVEDEFDETNGPIRVRLTAPDGESLDVVAQFCRPGSDLDWTLSVEAVRGYPTWAIRFHGRPDRPGDPAVTIDAPLGSTVERIGS